MRHIRWMIRRDLPEVLEIERLSFEFPATKGDMVEKLRQRNVIPMVVEDGLNGPIAGFIIYSLHKRFIEIDSIAVDPSYRRTGAATQLIARMKGKLSDVDNGFGRRRDRLRLVVRESNLSALKFFQACGFVACGLEKRPYDETTDDGIRMVFRHSFMLTEQHCGGFLQFTG